MCQCQVVCCNSRQAWGIYHPPTFPTCLPCGNMCRCKKEKKKILKKCPTFFPCRSLPKEKKPRKKLTDLPKIHLKKKKKTIFMSSFSSLQNFLIFLALVRYLQRDKRKGLLRMHQAAMILVHLCSQHWMQNQVQSST